MNSIRSKIMWLLISCVLASSLLISGVAIPLTSKVINQNANDNMHLLCQINADKIDIIFAKLEDSIDTLAHFAESELSDANELTNKEFRTNYISALEKNALHHIESTEGSVAVYMYFSPALINETDGFFYKRNDETDVFKKEDLIVISDYKKSDMSHVGWWYTPTEQGSPTWLEAHYNANLDHHIVSYVVPIYENDVLVGVIGADISTQHIENKVKQISVLNSGKAAVLKSDGTVVYHPNFERDTPIGKDDPGFDGVIEKLSKEEKTNELIPYKLKGESRRLASCKLRNGMLMICFAPASEIYKEQNALIASTTIITFIISVVALFTAFLVSKTLVSPLKTLNEAAKKLVNGEFDFNIYATTRDEIGELTHTFIRTRNILKHQFNLLDEEAHRDGLTGVGNKSAFIDKEAELNKAIAHGLTDFCIAVFDVNKLKITNDVFGHTAGDKLLCTVSNQLSKFFGAENIFRIGGDEFVVVIQNTDTAEEVLNECIDSMKSLSLEGYPQSVVSCAYGLAYFDKDNDWKVSDMLQRADKAMYKNKSITKKETLPWQEGEKGLKQLQIEKYSQLLKTLKSSTDDSLFILNTESGILHFFGNNSKDFSIADESDLSNSSTEILSFVHTNDHRLVQKTFSSIMNREADEIDINFRMHNNNKNIHWVNCRGNIIKDETDNQHLFIGRISQNAIMPLYNPITTLFNRAKLNSDLQNEKHTNFSCLMLLDIDALSEINLKYGSEYGDNLIKSLGAELEKRFSLNRIYHTEKDRFAVLLDSTSSKDVEKIFEDLKSALSPKCTISASVVPNDREIYVDVDNIYEYALQILSQSKKNGIGNIAFFSKESITEKIFAVELLEEIKENIKNDFEGFYLTYQPQINSQDYSIISAEALLRYNSKTKGKVYPDQMIPLLEKTGLINNVGIWVIDQALAQCKKWRKYIPDFKISVNISPHQLEKKSLTAQILKSLSKYELPGDSLIVEITESIQLNKNENLLSVFEKLNHANIQIAIDDFGTGYSNLSNLKHIHANILKIDQVFVKDIKENGYNYNLIHNIIEFSKNNSMRVCIEGVETKSELLVLSGLNPDYFQGYLFDKPCTPDEIEEKYLNTETDKYAQRLSFIQQLANEKRHAPIINLETKTILKGINIGLWIIRINLTTGEGELYADDTMRMLLGVENIITPQECYTHWNNNIIEGYYDTVNSMVDNMINSDKIIQAEYLWKHPTEGKITVRCTGRCIEKNKNYIVFEGFHRNISDMITTL